MDVREFEYLVKIAEWKSVTKAADELFITQSTLSKFLQKIEAEMGVKLFNRVSRQLIPTYAGDICIEAAKKIIGINDRLKSSISDITSSEMGRIRLGFHHSWSEFFFDYIFKDFQNEFPNIELQLYEKTSNEAIRMLDNGELDILLITSNWDPSPVYECELICEQHMVIVVREDHPLLMKSEIRKGYPYPLIDLKILHDVPVIMRHTNHKIRMYVQEIFSSNGIKPYIILETETRENAIRAVQQGIGITFALDDPIKLRSSNIQYLSYEYENLEKVFLSVVYNKGNSMTTAEKRLIEIVKHHFDQIKKSN